MDSLYNKSHSHYNFCRNLTLNMINFNQIQYLAEIDITYRHHEGYVNFARFPLHFLLAVDDVALNVVDGEVVETVLIMVPYHAAVIDTGLATVGVAAVLTHAGAVMETHRGGGEQRPLIAWDQGELERGRNCILPLGYRAFMFA